MSLRHPVASEHSQVCDSTRRECQTVCQSVCLVLFFSLCKTLSVRKKSKTDSRGTGKSKIIRRRKATERHRFPTNFAEVSIVQEGVL